MNSQDSASKLPRSAGAFTGLNRAEDAWNPSAKTVAAASRCNHKTYTREMPIIALIGGKLGRPAPNVVLGGGRRALVCRLDEDGHRCHPNTELTSPRAVILPLAES